MLFPELEPCRTTYRNTFVADFYREVHTTFAADLRTDFKAEFVDNFATDFHNPFSDEFDNPYSPSIDSKSIMSEETAATGRSTRSGETAASRTWASMLSADSMGAGAPNLLPVKFTDDSIIPIPVLPDGATQTPTEITGEPQRKKWFGLFRKKDTKKDFVIKHMTRREYLKYYAKDDEGRYIGTEEPAKDCILTHESDVGRHRRFEFSSDV